MLTPLRDPLALLERTRAAWPDHGDLWVFGYASLIWRPEFEAVEWRPALVRGWQTGTLLVKNGAFDARELAAIRDFAEARSFDNWASFEQEHPDTFAGMYQFWVRR